MVSSIRETVSVIEKNIDIVVYEYNVPHNVYVLQSSAIQYNKLIVSLRQVATGDS